MQERKMGKRGREEGREEGVNERGAEGMKEVERKRGRKGKESVLERKERGRRSVDRKGGVWIGKTEHEWGSERGGGSMKGDGE
jgi:hypothetical protein